MPSHHVANLPDLTPGTKSVVDAGGTEVLLCNVGGTVSALHPKCTHYGAPLVDGVLNDFRLVCPWHHACFDARTGRHLEAPGCDALRSYPVTLRGAQVWVDVPAGATATQQPNPMATADPNASQAAPYVVVGGGPAGQHAVEGLRQGGYRGPITLVSAEARVPYDRTQVSKGFLSGERSAGKMPLRPEDFYRAHGVRLRLGTRVERVDAAAHELLLEGGERLAFAKACIATGSTPRTLDVPGADLPAVFTLRSYDDAEALRTAAEGASRAVVIGSSFIGLEGAMGLNKLGCEVTVVAPEAAPFASLFGERVGRVIQGWHEETGVRFRLGEQVARIEGKCKATGVVLKSGDSVAGSLVLVGIGVRPNADLIDGIEPEEDGGIAVDAHGYAGHDLWVAGDIASAPHAATPGRHRIEHWRVAEQQGHVAGVNMAGTTRTNVSVPYFWTAQAGHNLRYVGHHHDFDNVVFDGRPEDGAFLAYYIADDRVAAVLAHQRDTDAAAIQELMWLGEMPSAEGLNPGEDWSALLRAA